MATLRDLESSGLLLVVLVGLRSSARWSGRDGAGSGQRPSSYRWVGRSPSLLKPPELSARLVAAAKDAFVSGLSVGCYVAIAAVVIGAVLTMAFIPARHAGK